VSISLAPLSAFVAGCAQARSIDMTAYTLRPGAVEGALVAAARQGAHVRVRLERDPLDDAAGSLHAANAATIAALRAAGADAATTAPGEPVLHLKAAVVDGVAWLDDRNWAGEGHETLVRDSDPDDARAVAAGIRGERGDDPHLSVEKGGALRLEARLISRAGAEPLAVESESFGSGAIYDALLHRAQAGLPTRLLVAGREAGQPGSSGETERRRLGRLAALGVEVRTGDPQGVDFDEKFAVAPHVAWVGSANATYAFGEAGKQRDWGMTTRQPVLIDGLRAAFEGNWNAAVPLAGATMTQALCATPSANTSATPRPAPSCEPRSISAWTSR
jgi:hypothetical protein